MFDILGLGFAFRPQIWRDRSSIKGVGVVGFLVFWGSLYLVCRFSGLMRFFQICGLCVKGFNVLFFCG